MTTGSSRRWISWSAAGAIVVTALVWLLWPRPAPADFAPVTRGPLVATLDEEGETRVRDRFVISAPVSGRLLRIGLEPGDPVVAGETVVAVLQPGDPVLLDPRSRAEAEEQVRSARAELERTRHELARVEADLAFARKEGDRARKLAAQGYLADEQLEFAELEETRAAEAIAAANHAVEGATHRLASTRARLLDTAVSGHSGDDPVDIRAPADGVVLRRIRESEAVVPAGTTLLEIGDPADIEIVADFLSTDAVAIRSGARVLIERWGGEGALVGHVRRVEPSGFTKVSALGVEEKRVNVIIDLDTPPDGRSGLADGFRVETRVIVWEDDDVVRAPSAALFRRGDGWAAFVVEGGRAKARAVEIGPRTPNLVAVVGGLDEGDVVVVHPADDLSDGARVAAREIPY